MKQFKCRKCGCREFRRKTYNVKGKGMVSYRRKLANQKPASFNRKDDKVVCKKCHHAQRL